MKKVALFFVVAVSLFIASLVVAKHFWRGEPLSQAQVAKKWGQVPFEANGFKNGSMATRSKMAAAILAQQGIFKGKGPLQIRQELGTPDGFYFTDLFPSYLIEEGAQVGQDSWQIVFLLDRNKKVSEVIVHKNCCDK